MPMPWSCTDTSPEPSSRRRQQLDLATVGRVAHGIRDQIADGTRNSASTPASSTPVAPIGDEADRVPAARQGLRVGRSTGNQVSSCAQRSEAGRGLPSSVARVSRSATRVCMRPVCVLIRCSIPLGSARERRGLQRLDEAGQHVSNVRISCETLATKSRRMAFGAQRAR